MNLRPNRQKRFLAVPLLATLVVACSGDGHGRQPISGKVTFRGQPLDRGTIQFVPVTGAQGTNSGAVILKGKYAVPRDSGLLPGRYRTLISSGEPQRIGVKRGRAKERIPAKYNSRSRVTIEVKEGQANTFEFTID